jgi:uncharacterized phage-associated protein
MEPSMPFPAVCVANEFIRLARAKGVSLTPMKLQKLVYFAHGWSLALTGQPLVSERIEAWQFGPVIPALYRELKSYGNGVITEEAGSSFGMRSDGKVVLKAPCLDDYPDDAQTTQAKEIIARVFEVYGSYSGAKLSNATHMQGTPWQQVYQDHVRSLAIPDGIIESYFKDLARAQSAQPAQR